MLICLANHSNKVGLSSLGLRNGGARHPRVCSYLSNRRSGRWVVAEHSLEQISAVSREVAAFYL